MLRGLPNIRLPRVEEDEQPYNPSLDPALKIAEFFGLPVEALLSLGPFRPLTDEIYGRRTP